MRKRWITEGVYWKWISEALTKSDVIIWLDFPLTLTTFRIIRRHLARKLADKIDCKDDLLNLLKYSFRYKFGKKAAYPNFKNTLKPYKKKVIIIRNSKEFENLIHAVSKSQPAF